MTGVQTCALPIYYGDQLGSGNWQDGNFVTANDCAFFALGVGQSPRGEAEIDTFQPIPFYTVALELPGLTVSGERMADKAAAKQLKETCRGANVIIKKVECKEKSEKPPALYDLTTLQRDANRLLGFTAQQTLDYLQSLYEKKLCTYPRTDRKSTRLNSSHMSESRMPSSA